MHVTHADLRAYPDEKATARAATAARPAHIERLAKRFLNMANPSFR